MSSIVLIFVLSLSAVVSHAGLHNLPPVAVDDEVVIYGYTNYLEIPVFANDFDPEGQPIEVVALESVDCGKAILLKGGAVGVYPDWTAAEDADSSRPVLIGHGVYLISDGQSVSKGQWFVWH